MENENENNSIHVLLIEDSPDDAELVLRELCRGGFIPKHERVETAEQMRAALQAKTWDIVIADYTMPAFSAAAALRLLRSDGVDVPFIIVSGTIGEATAVAAMKAGAQDYLTKNDLKRLVPAVRREMREAEVRRARNKAEARIEHMAYHDALTDLPNRLLFFEQFKHAMVEADRHGNFLALLFLDMNRFKTVNDTLGHEVGDILLRSVAERLQSSLKPGDTVARFGGDEFMLMLGSLSDVSDATHAVEKILECFVPPFKVSNRELFVTVSLGVTLYPRDDKSIHELLRNADIAMYRAKELGSNSYQFYAPEMTAKAEKFLALENDLRHALDYGEFFVEYQPITDCFSGQMIGMEALLRWKHHKYGLIAPGQFILLAEEIGLIVPIGEWVLRTACLQCRDYRVPGQPPLRLSVNLSTRQFHQRKLVESIEKILQETGFDPRRLDLEITETILMQQQESAIETMSKLKAMGIHLSIDDFGIGYSGLNYLKHFPIDTVKIDQSFVRDIPGDPDDAAIAIAIITMAHSLGLKVIAEGVETQKQMDFMRAHECDSIQGFCVSKSLPSDQLEIFLRNWNTKI